MEENKYDYNISLDFMYSFYGSRQLAAVCSICNEIPNYPIRNQPQGNSGADIYIYIYNNAYCSREKVKRVEFKAPIFTNQERNYN